MFAVRGRLLMSAIVALWLCRSAMKVPQKNCIPKVATCIVSIPVISHISFLLFFLSLPPPLSPSLSLSYIFVVEREREMKNTRGNIYKRIFFFILTIRTTIKINPHPKARHHAIPRLYKRSRHHEYIHPYTPPEQRQHGPLVLIIPVPRPRPGGDDIIHQVPHRLDPPAAARRGPDGHPPAVLVLGDGVQAHLVQQPADGGGRRRREEEPREPPERRPADGHQRRLLVALPVQPDGLERADVARHEGEDGHADPALYQDPEIGELKYARRRVLGGGRVEEFGIPGTEEVGEDDGEGGDAAEAL